MSLASKLNTAQVARLYPDGGDHLHLSHLGKHRLEAIAEARIAYLEGITVEHDGYTYWAIDEYGNTVAHGDTVSDLLDMIRQELTPIAAVIGYSGGGWAICYAWNALW